jgi:hypothetical protein
MKWPNGNDRREAGPIRHNSRLMEHVWWANTAIRLYLGVNATLLIIEAPTSLFRGATHAASSASKRFSSYPMRSPHQVKIPRKYHRMCKWSHLIVGSMEKGNRRIRFVVKFASNMAHASTTMRVLDSRIPSQNEQDVTWIGPICLVIFSVDGSEVAIRIGKVMSIWWRQRHWNADDGNANAGTFFPKNENFIFVVIWKLLLVLASASMRICFNPAW